MKHLKKFENKEELNEKLEMIKRSLIFVSEYDMLETYEIIEMLDELLKSSKDEIREIYSSLVENVYEIGQEHERQKNDCMLNLIRKFCSIIWA
jgi:hypothetical protein